MKAFARFVIFILIGMLVACGEPPRRINVLLIGIDTLRPDHLGCYGYDRDTSPAIDRLAREGVLIENALSQSPWTLPSFATVFTSLYPTQHGAMSTKTAMKTTFPTLGTILQERGYATGAVVNTPVLKSDYGVDRGFDHYDYAPLETRHADGTTKAVLEWIDIHSGEPFMVFAHYYDPHLPYSAPAPYDTLFDTGYTGPIGNSVELDEFPRGSRGHSTALSALTPADWNHLRSLYDGEIAFVDKAVRDLLKGVEDRELKGTTLIVLLSDHGEEFFEHGGFEHGHSLFNELLKVPLIFSLPGVLPQGARVNRQVRLVDVAPTILDLLDISPGGHIEGVSLEPFLTGRAESGASGTRILPSDVAYGEALMHIPELKTITAYPWKLICDRAAEDVVLFDLECDPDEIQPIFDSEHPQAIALRDMVVKTLIGLSDTWFVELSGGGRIHTFDLLVTAPRSPKSSGIILHAFLDKEGNVVRSNQIMLSEASNQTLRLEGLELAGTVTMAFKIEPGYVPINFDLAIDGAPALTETFLGEDLINPRAMPFVQREVRGRLSKGMPPSKPEAPYFLVWHRGSAFPGGKSLKLDEKMRKDLRTLGYIQ